MFTTYTIVFAVSASFVLFFLGALLFPTLTLEKKGNYLLFDKLKVPVVIAMIFYVPIVLVFNQGVYFDENQGSPIPALLIYGIITALIESYIVFRKEITTWFNQKQHIKHTLRVKS